MLPMGLELIFEGNNFSRLLLGMWTSVRIALIAMAISIGLGMFMGVLMVSKSSAIRFICRLYLEFVRIMPQLVLLFLVYFELTYVGINLLREAAAVIVFVLWGTAEMGDLVRSAITSIPRHQYLSAQALGLKQLQVYVRIIIPQAFRRLLPGIINLTNRMIMTTALVVLIGVVEVLKVAQQIIDAHRFDYPDAALWIYGFVFFAYFFMCYPISMIARFLERKWAI
ncbi:glutamate ABC transport system permease [Corynebacterium kutscheri]|uniref:Amine acid ABC transporter, permease protein, 3-TM region, His/Glu/Gln/Arg/opine family n=1 Tax=Corynebacterium kutscheri TaxID=35755 RepID=A0A0F6TD57_9CORY|nr:amino acid ABC transporter permease [Corynebacterium kutscheri]AKE40876.1 amine acid ABC transporter, permease protein, 3-TM region, His/Glu/Gln/Arg/opine family [Corynebacterium kutscheri]VEH06635.1 glutamate ABC transport system permease [Corynebacterium kutscheri]VEH09173.1 glutamate ABC transport system permease [Corynebacterium kutscheri]VEH82567.1 glutamate ABC transport system permease [Corynebacterium kutscheri]